MLTHLNSKPIPPKRVVILGAGGFVGGAIADSCRRNSIPILSLTRKEVNLLSEDAPQVLSSFLSKDDVFVAASAIAPVKTVTMLYQNLLMIKNMVEALSIVSVVHLLNIGSDAVFIDQETPLSEESPKAPTSLHGVMHLARELSLATLDIPQVTLRPTLIYGSRDPHNGYGPNRFRRQAMSGHDIVLFGDGEEQRDHVLINDVAELAIKIIEHFSTGSINIATGQLHSFREIAMKIVSLIDNRINIKGTTRSGPIPHNGYRAFNINAINEAFPSFAFTNLSEGLKSVYAETK